MWWSVVHCSSIGYGDLAPITPVGRLLAAIGAIAGIGLFTLPAGKTTYPVYVKDSLLNTNPAFDYGEFRRLASLAASATAEVRRRKHTQIRAAP